MNDYRNRNSAVVFPRCSLGGGIQSPCSRYTARFVQVSHPLGKVEIHGSRGEAGANPTSLPLSQ